MKTVESDDLDQSAHYIPERFLEWLSLEQNSELGVYRFILQYCVPAGELRARRTNHAAGSTLAHRVHQFAHCVDFRQTRFLDAPAKLLFKGDKKLHPLHRIQPKIEFEIVAGSD